MKKTLRSLFFLSAAFPLFAQQEFAPIGAVWHYTGREPFGPQVTFLRVESVGDTVILDRACRKLEGWFFFDWQGGQLFIHQKGDTVWFFNPIIEDFELLYNFNAQPGYSWSHSKAYGETSEFFSEHYRVDSTSSVVINGQTLRRLHISYRTESGSYAPQDDIVETLGSLHFLMYAFRFFAPPTFDATYPDGLRCYYDPEFGLYESGIASSCEAVPVRESPAVPEDIRAYPNPTADVLTIENLRAGPLDFTVSDVHGRTVLRGQSAPGHTELAAGHWPGGVYVIRFEERGKGVGRLRVVRK